MEIKVNIRTISRHEDGIQIFNDLEAPVSVVIKEQLKQPTTFTITYAEDICDGKFKVMEQQAFNPFSEIEIAVQIDTHEYVLTRGLVQGQQIKLSHGGEGSQVEITGADNSIRFGWETKTKNWKTKIGGKEILEILSSTPKTKEGKPVVHFGFDEYHIMGKKYDSFKNEIKGGALEENDDGETGNTGETAPFKAQMQRQDDLAFIKKLAELKGFYFWISFSDTGLEIVNFDRLPQWSFKEEEPTAKPDDAITLSINQQGHNDLDEFSISWDADRPTSAKAIHTDTRTKKDVVSEMKEAPQMKLGNKTLSGMTGFLLEAFQSSVTMDEKDLNDRTGAALNESEWFIKANCSTSYDKLCKNEDIVNDKKAKIFHAHKLIYILGAGKRHSGVYLVSGVTHTISPGSYKVQLELMRNAWVEVEEKTEDKIPTPREEESELV